MMAFTKRDVNDINVVDIINALEEERGKLGAVDGYDYRSGVEYGLRIAIDVIKRQTTPKEK